jgi:hypothetical protein
VLVVELGLDVAHELVGELPGADAARGLDPTLEDPGHEGDDGPVAAHEVAHPRPLDLDDDRMPVVKGRPVRLPQRRGGERLPLEPTEGVLDRFAELLLEHRVQLVGVHALNVGLEL